MSLLYVLITRSTVIALAATAAAVAIPTGCDQPGERQLRGAGAAGSLAKEQVNKQVADIVASKAAEMEPEEVAVEEEAGPVEAAAEVRETTAAGEAS